MTDSELLKLVAELQAAFAKNMPEAQKNIWLKQFRSFDKDQFERATEEIIRSEEKFPSIATMLRYLGQADRDKGIKQMAAECLHLASRRDVPYVQVLEGHLAMCRENLAITQDEDVWGTRIEWAEELLRREIA